MEEEIIVKCEVLLNRIFFPKNKNSVLGGEYAIFSANVIKSIENCDKISLIKLKGNVCKLEFGTVYKVTCRLSETNEQYGNTYEILYINKKIDISSTEKQKEFLSSIINENTVDNLFEMYNDVVTLFEEKDIESLIKVKGIGKATALRLIEEYEEAKDYSPIYTELGRLGLTPVMIKKLVDYYNSPDAVVEIVRNNPYDLVKINGIGFKKADEIALKLGVGFNDYKRVKGFLIHTLIEQGEMGKSYLHYNELMNLIYATLGHVEQEAINKTAEILMKNKEIVVLCNGDIIALKRYYDLEKGIYEQLIRIRDAENDFTYGDFDKIIKKVEKEQGFDFTEEQLNSIEDSTINNIVAITGGAGCGKTTVQKGIIALHENYDIMACALSGKASVRITEATGLPASTIHKTLAWNMGGFTYDENNTLPCDVLIVDEATMNNGDIFLAVLRSVKSGSKLILSGDVQQLTPIGNCQVYADILDSGVVLTSKLNKPHRQALKSAIITTSISIATQEQIFKSSFEGNMILGELQDMELDIEKNPVSLSDKVVSHFMKHYNQGNDVMDIQVTVAMKIRGDLSCYNINTKIQNAINPINDGDDFIKVHLEGKGNEEKFYKIKLGDKVINTRNNYKCFNSDGKITPVFNGNIGIVKEIDNGTCVVDFEGIGEIVLGSGDAKHLELAYACTVHKLQGSGFKITIVAIDGSSFILNNAELLYTAITRAKQYCVLVGKNSAIRACIGKREVKTKQTFLKAMLEGLVS